MSRGLTNDMVTEVTSLQLQPILLLKAEFDGGDLLLWSGVGPVTYDGDVYTGAGNLLGISELEETKSIEAKGATFQLSGIPSSLISLALTDNYQGRPITCYFGCLDGSGVLVTDPVILFQGIMDVLQIDEGGDTATIGVAAENRLIDLRRSKVRRYTPEDQKQEFAGDLGLDFVAALQEKEIIWGRTA